jgi:hypothetical protein
MEVIHPQNLQTNTLIQSTDALDPQNPPTNTLKEEDQKIIKIDSLNCLFTNKKVVNKILLIFEVKDINDNIITNISEINVAKRITHPNHRNNEQLETFTTHYSSITQPDGKKYKCTFIDVGGMSTIKFNESLEPTITLDDIPSKLVELAPNSYRVITTKTETYKHQKLISSSYKKTFWYKTPKLDLSSSIEDSKASIEASIDVFVKNFVVDFTSNLKTENELLSIKGTCNGIPDQNTVQRTGEIIKEIIRKVDEKQKNPFVITFNYSHIEQIINDKVIYFKNDLLPEDIENYTRTDDNSNKQFLSIKINGTKFNVPDRECQPDINFDSNKIYTITNLSNTTIDMYTNIYLDKTFGNGNITTGNIATTSATFSFNNDIEKVRKLFEDITKTATRIDSSATVTGGRRKYRYSRNRKIKTKKRKTFKNK